MGSSGVQAYRLASSTALRQEPFGGIAYSHSTRRLQLIQSRLAVEVALRLEAGAAVDDVVGWLERGDPSRRAVATRKVVAAIDELVASGILVPVSSLV